MAVVLVRHRLRRIERKGDMRLSLVVLALIAIAGSASAASSKDVTLTIRHQMHGCHTWSTDGTAWRASQTVVLHRGAAITVVDNDVMPHTIVQLAGPKASVLRAAMTRMGATARIRFATTGRYVFKTKAGEDYTNGIKTTGEDNVLRLVVRVQ